MVNDGQVPFFLQIAGLLSGSTGAAEASLYVRVEATASLRGGYRLGSWDGARCGIPWRYKDRSGKGCRFRIELYVCYMSSIFYMSSIAKGDGSQCQIQLLESLR
jgi:hypothetical protein